MLFALVLSLLAPSAMAAPPRFVSHDPQLEEAARRAWTAAEQCTGWTAPAHEQVEIASTYLRGGYAGGAQVDRRGLAKVVLWSDVPERALVHEIAHAWARSGPPTLNEGRADLLADCIARTGRGLAPLDPDSGRDLDFMPDLRHWVSGEEGRVTDIEALRSDAYLAAGRFLRVVATVVEPQRLWPRSGRLDWPDIEDMLLDAGPRGQLVQAVVEAGRARQRDALSDRDRDGIPWLAEVLDGTDPERWDSDGDGWWDGAPDDVPRVAAVPLPRDGTPVCSGLSGGKERGTALVLAGGALRGDRAQLEVRAGGAVLQEDPAVGVEVPAGAPLLVALGGDVGQVTGGMWALAGGQGLVLDWNCRSTPRYTVWVDDPPAAMLLADLARELDVHLARAEAALGGPAARRVVVVLGDGHAAVASDGVHIASGWVEWAQRTGRVDALAGVAVALHRVWESDDADERRWDVAEALTRLIVDDPPDLTFVAVDLGLVDRRAAEAEACAEGWFGMLRGRCR
jgi:hypothetical protein